MSVADLGGTVRLTLALGATVLYFLGLLYSFRNIPASLSGKLVTSAFGSVFYLLLTYLLLRQIHKLDGIETVKERLPYWGGYLALMCLNVAAWGVMLMLLK